jgi:hypothetical protein
LEQPTTDKAKVIATLKAAYAHAKTATRFKFQVQSISKTGAIRGPELRVSLKSPQEPGGHLNLIQLLKLELIHCSESSVIRLSPINHASA